MRNCGGGDRFRDAMAYEFKLPDLGEGLTEGEIARWLVSEGQDVGEDDPLVEIQTDKTTVEIASSAGKPGHAPTGARVRATPLVRSLAKELGVELEGVAGSGPGGRVTDEDVRAAAASSGPAQTLEGRREPLRGVRKLIAE